MSKPINIIGGGLAGLTLGIGLRQREVPVVVWEAGGYPRHRVCGEFISGRGQGVLERLGLKSRLVEAGSGLARTAKFFVGDAESPVRALSPPALCLSRYKLDALLAKQFVQLGGQLHTGRSWPGYEGVEGLVHANGRRPTMGERGWGWFGLKVHARGVELAADLEMHAQPQGYVGLCRLGDGEVNVCGLFRRNGGAGGEMAGRGALRGAAGTALAARLGPARFDASSFRAVAGLGLQPQRAGTQGECRVGDALTMIPPVTGNGMSMAFEAAELAIAPLVAWSQRALSWAQARAAIATGCDRRFGQRLAWARVLQCLMFSRLISGASARLLLGSGPLWRLLFQRTR
jgi:2-polyprenyl-6-methoxyphenol hydroxylase-like FAD-dependent oxidoreductase